MADPANTPSSPSNPRGSRSARGGNSQARSKNDNQHQDESQGHGSGARGSKNSRGGKGRGKSRGGSNSTSAASLAAQAPAVNSTGRPPGGGFGARLTEAASKQKGDSKDTIPKEQETSSAVDDEAEICFICASPIEHVAIAPCNHQTCHICSLRLRALYKTRACAHCRTESPFVIFTDNADKRFEDFTPSDFVKVDDNLGIKYEKDVILEDTILLLRYNCPDRECEVACLGWPDLHRHVKTKHGKIMCDHCTRHKKVFTHEHELFTFGDLRKHERFGDDNPGAIDQSGFKGHPECGFCRQRFYGDDELYTHCRERHERCHICDRRNGGRNPQYYLDYAALEKHFAKAHHVCLDAECQANKTNVFESEMDLKAHQLSEHPNGLSKDARRDARLVNLSGFDLRTPYQPERRGGRQERNDRGIGRGRDPNADPLPVSSAQPLSRAELAYQRQLAIQSSQSVSSRSFGGQLTQAAPVSRPQTSTGPPRSDLPPMENLSLNQAAQPPPNMTPQEQARNLRHQAVISRAASLLKNDQTKLSQFRTHISAYRSGTSSATDLIDAIFDLFDSPSSEIGKLVRELADLYEDETKQQSLLSAWNNWRSINEDYPSLPGPSGTLPGVTGSGSGGRRVLTLKKSTVQSSRSAVSRQGSWGNSITNGTSSEPFPALGPSKGNSRKTAVQLAWGQASAPTGTSTNPSASQASSIQSSRSTARKAPPLRQTEENFPSLPVAAKPNTMMAGFNTRGSVRWLDSSRNSPSGSGTNTPAWGNGGMAPTPAQAAAAMAFSATPSNETGEGELGSSKKKGKKGKGKGETLFHFG
ncbi:hypothetical protein PV10_02311 [Exophiala mesophila]|uniref:RING-type E3 ubiquitin transferase n=1 Tax=Exophiala mesophila TaxID=212818 RepID=A0A0D1Y208_EXOME|nr:uncharacterized protein PV10_02311 [Exophiala mesophila]KIV94556.1 hypothetical protein PV10_02311 [Exophiala mesophila]